MGETRSKVKNYEIESLRGLAILLMVAGHVIGSGPDRGMQVPDSSVWHFYFVALEDIRMPLFTVLSGFVYAYRPLSSTAGYPRMVKGKARRLLVPLLTVGTLLFATQALLPGTNSKPFLGDFWRIYIWGIEHLWFVQAIFLIFLLVGILDAYHRLDSVRNWAIAFTASAVAFVFLAAPSGWNIFSVNGAIRLLPFFLLGYALHRFPPRRPRPLLIGGLAVFAVAFTIRMVELAGVLPEISGAPDKALAFAIGTTACGTLMLARRYIYLKPLAVLGPFAFGVYLLHVFGSAGMRMALEKVGIETPTIVFAACMVAAVGLPILFEVTFGRVPWISWAVLGQKAYRTQPAPPARREVLDGGGARVAAPAEVPATAAELP